MSTISLNNLNAELKNIISRISLTTAKRVAGELQQATNLLNTGSVGSTVDSITNGFKTLTSQVDQPGGQPVEGGVVMLADDPNGLAIRNSTPSNSSDLSLITESTTGGGFLQAAVTADTPRAVYSTLKKVSSGSPDQIINAISPFVSSEDRQLLSSTLKQLEKGIQPSAALLQEIEKFSAAVNTAIDKGVSSILGNVVESLTGSYSSAIQQIIGSRGISPEKIAEVISKLEANDIVGAADALRGLTDLSTEQVEAILSNLPSGIADAIEDAFDQELPDQIVKQVGESRPSSVTSDVSRNATTGSQVLGEQGVVAERFGPQ